MKIEKQDVQIFLKTILATATAILFFAAGYFSVCRAYEAMRITLFGDHRSAVVIADGYIKFFDLEFHIE
jgi:hypothetical protein